MALIGYARVSTHGQKDDSQVAELKAAGCTKIFVDHGVSGKLARRPELDNCLAYMRDGQDTLVITRLARAMRSLKHMIILSNDLNERNIGLKVIKQSIDTTTSTGRLMFHMLAAIDEFQREIIVEGTNEGLAVAREAGKVGGRKVKITPEKAEIIQTLNSATDEQGRRKYTIAQIAAQAEVSVPTLYRYFDSTGERRQAPHKK